MSAILGYPRLRLHPAHAPGFCPRRRSAPVRGLCFGFSCRVTDAAASIFGVTGRNRTYSHSVNSRTLCLLSYDNKKRQYATTAHTTGKGASVVQAVVEKNSRRNFHMSYMLVNTLAFSGDVLYGRSAAARTQTNGFGDRCAANYTTNPHGAACRTRTYSG